MKGERTGGGVEDWRVDTAHYAHLRLFQSNRILILSLDRLTSLSVLCPSSHISIWHRPEVLVNQIPTPPFPLPSLFHPCCFIPISVVLTSLISRGHMDNITLILH